ncbi:MAG TPA: aldose epimerase family protein [Longimicrobiales bacterium]
MPIEAERFEVGGRDARAWRLVNGAGSTLRVAGLGGAILSLEVPDRAGRLADVVLGYAAPASYATNPSYLGVLVGRYANRIAGARFAIDGREYRLERNSGPNQLHGGVVGFSHAAWRGEPFEERGAVGVVLEYTSPDGDGGYPGSLRARATYRFTAANELMVDFEATTDAPTHVNLTQHSYFNLAGHDDGDVLGHVLVIAADRFLAADGTMIPTGELRDVTGTPFDFRAPTRIGERIAAPDEQLRIGRGYDHCFVLADDDATLRDETLRFAARLVDPASGRALSVHTSEPGMQLYTGNWLGDGVLGKGGTSYGRRCAVALETQHFPDSPNRPEFPSTLLRPGETYRSHTVYAFEVE